MMGASNFFMGWSSRLLDPVMASFLSDFFIALVTGAVLLSGGKFKHVIRDSIANKKVLLQMSIADNAAWLAFAFALTVAPIGVVVALSESYIVIAVILGLTINKEKIHPHQRFGLLVAVISALVLAGIASS